jgi:UPF0716 family protein affecting phage T7 exclusion
MKLKLNIFLLSLVGLAVVLPPQVQAYDGMFMAKREVLRDRRDARMTRKARQEEQRGRQTQELREERERESEPSYGYGYERRHEEKNFDGKDGRGRR